MNKTRIILCGCGACLLLLFNCVKKVGKLPVKSTEMSCDSITYANHVQAIVENKCVNSAGVSCHVSGGSAAGYPLTDIQKVKNLSAQIDDAVFGKKTMPMGSNPLTTEEKDKLRCWLDNGMKD